MMLVDVLKRIQDVNRLTDAEFATRLRIHRVSWNRVKHGHRHIGGSLQETIWHEFPKLRGLLGDYIIARHPAIYQTHYNQKPGGLKGFLVGLYRAIHHYYYKEDL